MDRKAVEVQNMEIKPQHREWFFHGLGIRPDMAEAEWQELIGFMDTEGLQQFFYGHTHMPFSIKIGDRLICNAGSVGASLDGDPRAAWVMYSDEPHGIPKVSIRRIPYDVPAILDLIDQTPNYYLFSKPGFREAY